MIKQFISKQRKIARGIYFTFLKRKGKKYNDKEYWDKTFYTNGISDRQTIAPKKNPVSSKYHYTSVELQILKAIFNEQIDLNGGTLLDIGSGSGHWIDFYRALGLGKTIGVDVSRSSIDYLNGKYKNNRDVSLHHGKIIECIDKIDGKLDLVNAIGVMFHIVDDEEWKASIEKIAGKLNENGVFIVGGHFGWLNGINVQFDKENFVNKRLRSRMAWKRTLKEAGFSKIRFYKNPAYLHIKQSLPENNLLIATR